MTDASKNKSSLPVLPQIQIKTPCPMNWDDMKGDSQKRFCGHCQKHVHNFEQMAAGDVNELLVSGQNVCAKILRRTDGSIVTKETRITRRNWLGKLGALAASILALVTLGGCREPADDVTGSVAPLSTVEAPVLMGEVDGSELGDVAFVQPELVAEQPGEPVKMLGKVMKPASK
jgi:hypothetical protein